MRARDIMNSPVVTVQPWRPVKEVATLLIDHEITALPVLDADGHLVGIVTEADLVSLEKDPDPRAHILPPARRSKRPARTVEELMTKQVVWVHPEADAAEVADLMWTNRIRSIPVVAE
ncbi:MAG TPA: CBS domain-containing protein, partial [Actinomycetota bacterium]